MSAITLGNDTAELLSTNPRRKELVSYLGILKPAAAL